MKIPKSKKNSKHILELIAQYDGTDLYLLTHLVLTIRPSSNEIKAEIMPAFDQFIKDLKEDERLRNGLQNYLRRLLKGQKISSSLTDANIVTGINFWRELKKRIVHKILPNQPEKDSIENLLVNVFYHPKDGKWVSLLNDEKCKELIEILGFEGIYERNHDDLLLNEILFSIKVLTYRISGSAFNVDILRMVPEYANLESPFAALQTEIDYFLKIATKGRFSREKDELHYKQIHVLITQCRTFISQVYKNKEKYGISFSVHQHLMKMERLLDRLNIVLYYVVKDDEIDSKVKLASFIKRLILINAGKSKIRGYINKSTQLMAREFTQNIGTTGEKYITKNSREYWKMFNSALGGGVVVAFACIIKMELSHVESSIFGKALLYSLNYAWAFIAIYLFHFTLATKQPAMTASRLAQIIEIDEKQNNKFENLPILVARVFRSQFIAFVGNVIMAFIVAMVLVYLWAQFIGLNPATHSTPKLLQEIDILQTPVIFHAAIAGVFLFISGLITGKVYNKTKYLNIPLRIKEQPVLKMFMSLKSREKLASYYDRNAGAIIGNFWFGVFMGCTSSVGLIFGLNLDIRHITFAAGNFGLALYGLEFNISYNTIIGSLIGIIVIGATNFIVSFTLSLLLALRARGIAFISLYYILGAVKDYFLIHPFLFMFPPKDDQVVDLMAKSDSEKLNVYDKK